MAKAPAVKQDTAVTVKTPAPPVKNPVKKVSQVRPVVSAPAVHTESKSGHIKVPSSLVVLPKEMDNQRYRDLQAEIDAVERGVGVDTMDLIQAGYIQNAISSGILMYDFVVGGGVAPGRFSILPGLEGSGKSTVVDNLAAVCTLQGIPTYWFDAEAALDPNYAGRIFDRYGLQLSQLMGTRDPKTQKWIVPPVIRYTQDAIGQHIFKTIHGICKSLPTVRQSREGVWYKVVAEKGKQPKWVEDERGGKPQYLFIVDSWPALLTEAMDEDNNKSPMAAQARMFSDYIKMIKAPISQKNCVMFSVNQLRLNPMAGMGNPSYEPGGQALKFFSDVRTEINRVAPGTVNAGKGKFTEEESINGGVDQYVYAKIKNTKNKAFSPFREGVMRIRFTHDGAPGDGVCETYDVIQFLLATGQMERRGDQLRMRIRPATSKSKNNPFYEEGKVVKYRDFKLLVEAPEQKRAIYKHCWAQLRSGYAFEIEREAVKAIISQNAGKPRDVLGLLDGPSDEDEEGGIQA